jgi:hypothetical protein
MNYRVRETDETTRSVVSDYWSGIRHVSVKVDEGIDLGEYPAEIDRGHTAFNRRIGELQCDIFVNRRPAFHRCSEERTDKTSVSPSNLASSPTFGPREFLHLFRYGDGVRIPGERVAAITHESDYDDDRDRHKPNHRWETVFILCFPFSLF